MSSVVYKDLSYQLVGIIFEIHNKLGGIYEEKIYQRAIEEKLKDAGLTYKRELKADLYLDNIKIGNYFLDFLIEDKIVLELKTVPKFLPEYYRQIKSYIKMNNYKLGLLVNFRGSKVQVKRILNSQVAE